MQRSEHHSSFFSSITFSGCSSTDRMPQVLSNVLLPSPPELVLLLLPVTLPTHTLSQFAATLDKDSLYMGRKRMALTLKPVSPDHKVGHPLSVCTSSLPLATSLSPLPPVASSPKTHHSPESQLQSPNETQTEIPGLLHRRDPEGDL